MIRRIEALNYRCLRYVNQELDDFQVLVGPNASGRTSFLDVVEFLGDLVSSGLDYAISNRSNNLQDLLWQKQGDGFELAIELQIPEKYNEKIADKSCDIIRYEVAIGWDAQKEEHNILYERALLAKAEKEKPIQKKLFPEEAKAPDSICNKKFKQQKTIISKVPGGNDNFYSEVYEKKGKGWAPSFKLGPRKSTLGNLLDDESKLPVATWMKNLLSEGVCKFVLNSMAIKKASPPGKSRNKLISDGSNLPWVIQYLQEKDASRFDGWIAHLQTAFPDIETIRTVERADDRHRYLVIRYAGGLEVPSWMVSDGTLRLLALTLPAYLPDFSGIYLIEEPENGIHPKAVETMFQSLSSAYNAQILLATHSPVILSIAKPEQVLCFSKTHSGAADIVRSSKHPRLRGWKGETNLGVLFAGGVLG